MASLLWKSEGNSIIPYLIYGKGLVIMGFARNANVNHFFTLLGKMFFTP